MNFLVHLYLSGDEPEILVGNMMGDFVKGRLEGRYPPRITLGLRLHRRIDSFAGRHPSFLASKRRIDPAYGLYRGVLVDLFYDHFLAAEWEVLTCEPFPGFITRAERILEEFGDLLPGRLRERLPDILHDWLPSYREVGGIERVLARMTARVGRPNPLGEGGGELRRHYGALRDDFYRFFPEVQADAAAFLDAG